MSKFVHNLNNNRWVIVAPGRVKRPEEPKAVDCPFCPGRENLNRELFSVNCHPEFISGSLFPALGGEMLNQVQHDTWLVRVIANKFPLADYHEVIIHSPDHDKNFDRLPPSQVELILKVFRARFSYLRKFGKVVIFHNHGELAGESLSHPHSQIVVVPPEIPVEEIPREPVANEIVHSSLFTAYCPDYSEWPYEVWIAPLCHAEFSSASPRPGRGREILKQVQDDTRQVQDDDFGQITDAEISDLAGILQKVLQALQKMFPGASYNFYIYHGENWYIRIMPRLVYRAGFELGTGIMVNIVEPKTAAVEYKEAINVSS